MTGNDELDETALSGITGGILPAAALWALAVVVPMVFTAGLAGVIWLSSDPIPASQRGLPRVHPI
jgi:hypothetical protein